MKHLFILNPTAGKRNARPRLEAQIMDVFGGLDYQIVHPDHSSLATEAARQAGESGLPVRIYACGGDGTLNAVVGGAAGYDNVAVTNVPVGTGNDFLKIFGADVDRFHDLAALRDGPQVPMDIIDCNGKLGLDIVCAGIDARVAADVHKYKAIPLVTGIGAYILALVANVLFKHIARPMTVTVEGQTHEEELTLLCVCNGRHYGGGFMPVGDAMPDDGILDILLVKKVSRPTFFRLVGKYATGRYRECPDLIYDYHTDRISFSSQEPITVVVDGEVMVDHNFELRLSEKKVNFFYPQGLSYQPTETQSPVGARN